MATYWEFEVQFHAYVDSACDRMSCQLQNQPV